MKNKVLVLALGNDILGDDGVGFHAARGLKKEFGGCVDIVESSEVGLGLLDLMEGYDKVLLLDAIVTLRNMPGTVLEYGREDFRTLVASSPHFAGMPELLHLAERLGMSFPKDIRILALEILNPTVFSEDLTQGAQAAMPDFIGKARQVLCEEWNVLEEKELVYA